jgi:hypothetical protein
MMNAIGRRLAGVLAPSRPCQSMLRTAMPFLVFALCTGCATNFRPAQPFAGKSSVSSVYIYSFLDLREGTIGPNFLTEVRQEFARGFESRAVRTKQLWFNESPLRAQYALQSEQTGPGKSSLRVPVDEVIAANRADEESIGTTHRLVIFPIQVSQSSSYSGFQVRWDIRDAKTNELNWSTTSYSQHQRWVGGDENPAGRAKEFVEAAIAEMEKAGVFRKASEPR